MSQYASTIEEVSPVGGGSISRGTYRCSSPLVHKSRLTTTENGGIGKDLSEGWCLNFAVGCTHGCPFCYVDSIHKRFGPSRFGEIAQRRWGDYILIPDNVPEAISLTNWSRWKGKEVMMSSTHDPYIPELRDLSRMILEAALPEGVRFCIQTRSTSFLRDLNLLSDYRGQVRVQVSVATMDRRFASMIEPRAPEPIRRLEALAEAKASGIEIGVIVAPVFPSVRARTDVREDLDRIACSLEAIGPERVYGECLHRRGGNVKLIEEAIGEPLPHPGGMDSDLAAMFGKAFSRVGLGARWWSEGAGPPNESRAPLGPARFPAVIGSRTGPAGEMEKCSIATPTRGRG